MAVIVTFGTVKREAFELGDELATIGRARRSEIPLSDFQVSRRHAELYVSQGGYVVRDLGSRNGFYHNGEAVESGAVVQLEMGDELVLGRTGLRLYAERPACLEDLEAPVLPVEVATTDSGAELVAPAESEPPEPRTPEPKRSPSARGRRAASRRFTELREEPEAAPSRRSERSRKGSSRRLAAGSGRASRRARRDSGRGAVAAEVQSLKSMLDRSERERGFYRYVTTLLMAFLMIVVVVLMVRVLDSTPPSPEPERAAVTPGRGTRARASQRSPGAARPLRPTRRSLAGSSGEGLDAEAFARHILPWLATRCLECHEVGGARAFSFDPENAAAALAAAGTYVVPGYPEESVLLTKPLAEERGGEPHSGGALLSIGSPEFRALRDWINGSGGGEESPPEQPPAKPTGSTASAEVTPAQGPVGIRVVVDGRGSSSGGRSTLLCQWRFLERPDGSAAEFEDDGGDVTTFIPDLPGRYRFELRVDDGDQVGRAELQFVALLEGVGAAPGRPPSGAEAAPAASAGGVEAARIGPLVARLYGRPMTEGDFAKIKASSVRKTLRKAIERSLSKRRWLKAELDALGVVGEARPSEVAIKRLSRQLTGNDPASVTSVLVEVFISPSFNFLYADAKAYVSILFKTLLGGEPKGGGRLAALRMYEGREARVFGVSGRGQADLVAILLAQPAFRDAFIARSFERYTGRAPSAIELGAAASAFAEEPTRFFRQVEAWLLLPE